LPRFEKLTIVALFSDDELFGQLVLKGGNALSLVYGLSSRSSLDLDFSIEKDFADLDDIAAASFTPLRNGSLQQVSWYSMRASNRNLRFVHLISRSGGVGMSSSSSS